MSIAQENEKLTTKDNLITGPIGKELFLFAMPLLGASIIQQFYNIIDLIFVGRILGTTATAAVGASSLIVTCLVGFFTGLSVGVGVIVSNAVGEKNDDRIQKTIHTAMGISLIGGILVTVIGIVLSPYFLNWLNTPESAYDQAVVYIRVYFLSMIPLFIYNMDSGIIRAGGNSKTPLIIQLIGGIINIIFNWFALCILKMDVGGAALSTVVSQVVTAVLAAGYLMKQEGVWHLSLRKITIDPIVLKVICQVGIPAGLQSMVITLSNIFVQYGVNSLGVDETAAYAIYGKVEMILYIPIVSFGQSITTFAGQNAGAGNYKRINKGVWECIAMGLVYTVAMSIVMIIFGDFIFGLFSEDSAVVACGVRFISVTFPFYWLYVFLEVYADAIRGVGKSVPPMVIILLNICVLRTILLFIFLNVWGTLESVAAVYPCAWFGCALCLFIYWIMGKWKPEGVGKNSARKVSDLKGHEENPDIL